MQIEKTKFKDLIILRSEIFKDNRGFFKEINKKKILKKNLIFDCLSHSIKNTIRGLHFQAKKPQGKFITVVQGEILDVAVDLRKNSKTFGKTFEIVLSKENALGLFIPSGFAHAYYSFNEENIIYYKLDNYYMPKFENGIIYNDAELNLKWPKKNITVSKKDRKLPTFNYFCKSFGGL